MAAETALDTSVAIRYLKGDAMPTAASYAVARVIALLIIILLLPIVAKLLFRAENSARSLQNLTRLQFIEACAVVPMGRETATY
ncbi:MAG: hypothetical protein V7K38_07185 [Nostoc sp.]